MIQPPSESDRPNDDLGLPDIALIVEELDPAESFSRVCLRVCQYLAQGVKMVWLVHPEERAVSVYRKDEGFVFLEAWDELPGTNDTIPCRLSVGEFVVPLTTNKTEPGTETDRVVNDVEGAWDGTD